MSNSKAENAIDEVDLSDIFSLFKRWFYNILALSFKTIDFIFKWWWVVLLLIIIGAVVGKFTTSPTNYKTTIIVKTNFNSQSYVYNAIEQLDTKLADKDTSFLAQNKLVGTANGVIKLEITPIIDIASLLEGMSKTDSRSLTSVLKEVSVNDEEEFLASEQFYSNYKYHKLEIDLLGQDQEYVANVLKYVNKQPVMLSIKEGYVKNRQERIGINDLTLTQIDTLISSYSNTIEAVAKNAKDLSFYNNQNDINFNGILDFKNKLTLETEELKNDQITLTDALVPISDILIVKDISFKDKKYLLYPLLLVFLFLFLAGVRYTYSTLRKQLVEANLLD